MNNFNYRCPKCANTTYEVGEIRVTGGFWSKIFDVQGSKFTRITCTKCKYTELYKGDSSMLENIFDLFTN